MICPQHGEDSANGCWKCHLADESVLQYTGEGQPAPWDKTNYKTGP